MNSNYQSNTKVVAQIQKELNLEFETSIFSTNSQFYEKLAFLWVTEAEIQEILSLLLPELSKLNVPILIDFGTQLQEKLESLKIHMTECLSEVEQTREEMYEVAKEVIKQKQQYGGNERAYQRKSFSDEDDAHDLIVKDHRHSNSKQLIEEEFKVQEQKFKLKATSPTNQDEKRLKQLLHRQQEPLQLNLAEQASVFEQIEQEEEHKEEKQGKHQGEWYQSLDVRENLPFLKPDTLKTSIWSVLKENIGKDLSKMTFPVAMNEPLSLLQKCGEQMHYEEVIRKGLTNSQGKVLRGPQFNSLRALAHLAIFSVTAYPNIIGRTSKPFNPLLGETYELVTPNFRFLGEHVCNNPPITAFYMDGPGYRQWGINHVTSHFKGGSVELRSVGLKYIEFEEFGYDLPPNQLITVQRPNTSANNLVFGQLYIDVHGEMIVQNRKTKEECRVHITRQGWTNKKPFWLEGKVTDAQGNSKYEVFGRWNDKMYLKEANNPNAIEELIWEIDPKADNYERQHHFDKFAINLNAPPDEEMLEYLPPTDSRRRPDVRLLESYEIQEATAERNRIEEKQRQIYKKGDKGNKYTPLWFDEVIDDVTGQKMYRYNKKYFEKRKTKDWSECPNLFH